MRTMRPLISAGMVQILRNHAEATFDSTCVVYRNEYDTDNYFGNVGSAVARGTSACHIKLAGLITPELRENANQQVPDATWEVKMPWEFTLTDHDYIVWNKNAEPQTGGTIQVVQEIQRSIEIVQRAVCKNAEDFNAA